MLAQFFFALRGRGIVSAAVLAAGVAAGAVATLHGQVAGPNVNMVSGKTLPNGDVFLQRQNEPSGGISTRNPLHLLAGANDYRTVDLPGLPESQENGDAWLGVFKSYDGGQTWKSTLLPGYPQDTSPAGLASPIKGFQAGADPTVRSGPNGMFYYSGIAFNRGTHGLGAVFVSRFIDNNNDAAGDPIQYLSTVAVDTGTEARFLDKPYLVVDIPRAGALTCTINAPGAGGVQKFAAGAVYLSYTAFTGEGATLKSRIMASRSDDCGATWSKPTLVSEQNHLSQGASMAIDPATGTLFVAWRQFADATGGNAVLIAKSKDVKPIAKASAAPAPLSFSLPVTLSMINPFDQGSTPSTFRTNAYPTIAIDGIGRVYVAWSERGWGPYGPNPPSNQDVPPGDARVVLMTSKDGVRWTDRVEALPPENITDQDDHGRARYGHFDAKWNPQQPIENTPGRGHQIMPVLTFLAGKLSVVYYDLREDVSSVFDSYVDEKNIFQHSPAKRHTLDVRVAQALPADAPVFNPSVKVSEYLFGSRPGSSQIEQLQFNVPNLPLYVQGTTPFIGDYIDMSGEQFVKDAVGKWIFNTLPTGPGTLHAFWTDNRDVRPPSDGNWTLYTPPQSAFTAVSCSPGRTGMRNSNIYTSAITPGLIVGSPSNSKRLNPNVQRSFVVLAQNNTDLPHRYRFTIPNQPPGGHASFLQFSPVGSPLTTLDATIPPRSTASRTVYVTSTSPTAQVPVNIVEVEIPATPTPQPPVKVGGLQSVVFLNPDVTNPDVTNPDVTNEVFNPDVTNPDVTNPDVTNPDVTNPDVTNPDVTNVRIANPDVTNPDVTNPDVTNPDVTNPDVTNPDVTNADLVNGSIVDVSWTVRNNGNAAGSFAVKTFLTKNAPPGFKKQLIVQKIYTTPITTFADCTIKQETRSQLVSNIVNPDVTNANPNNPDVTNPDVTNPDVTNATLSLAPGETARITLRVVDPDRSDNVVKTVTMADGSQRQVLVDAAFDASQNVSTAVVSQAVNTQDAQNGVTTPPAVIALTIDTTSLPDGLIGSPYIAPLSSTGGAIGPKVWALAPGSAPLPSGLVLNPATGVISGTPLAFDRFAFTVQVSDSAIPPHVRQQDLVIRIAPLALAAAPSTREDQSLAVTLDAVSGSLPLVFAITAPPAHGVLSDAPPHLTYTPTANYSGPDSFAFTVTVVSPIGPVTSNPAIVDLTVLDVNDAPSFGASNVAVLEDAGPQAVPNWANGFSPGPANEASQTVLSYQVVGNTNPTLFAAGPSVAPNGTLTYTPAGNANGSAIISVTVRDSGGTANGGVDTSAPLPFTITVGAVNDAPSFVKGPDVNVAEDAGPQSIPAWASAILAGPPDEALQSVSFLIQNSNPAMFSTVPAIAPDGRLTFTAAAGVNGQATITVRAQDTGGVANGGVDTSAPQSFTITVASVNSAPSFTKGPDVTVVEDAGPQTVAAWATNISPGGADEAAQTITFLVQNSNAALFSTQPAIAPNGTLTFTSVPNANGQALVTVRAQDSGGTANGGVDTSAPQAFTIIVSAVNDAPSFAKGPDVNVVEDAGPQSIAAWATVILAGPPDEAAQTVSFLIQNSNPALFSAQPAIASDGRLTFTAGPGANGQATITVRAQDTGGVANGGIDTSAPQQFTITVGAVNNAPSFVKGPDVAVAEDAGPQTIPAWATAINPGAPDEAAQTVTFLVQNGNAALFLAQPAIAPNGTLTFTATANANGQALVTVRAQDSGGTANGGVDTSAPQMFTITVSAVNDAPFFTKGPDQFAPAPTLQTVPNWASNISAGPADESGQTLTFIVTADDPSKFAVTPQIDASGTLTYTPAFDATGVTTVHVVLKDDGGTSAGGIDTSAEQTFTIAFASACAPKPGGMIAWWRGEGDADDAEDGHNGVISGPVEFAAGKVGQGFSFHGAGAITVPATPALYVDSAVTLEAWISLASVPAAGTDFVIATKGLTFTTENYGLYLRRANDGSAELLFEWFSGLSFRERVSVGANLRPGSFHHVAVTADESVISFYVDGQLVSAGAQPAPFELNDNPLRIGSAEPNFGNRFDGVIDELGLFTRALTAEEIASIYAAGSFGICTNAPPVATDDTATTTTASAVTLLPSANDVDPDVSAPRLLQAVRLMPDGAPYLAYPTELAFVAGSHRVYFSAGSAIGSGFRIGILDSDTNTVVGAIELPVSSGQLSSKVNQATGIAYFRGNNVIMAIDGRAGSPTFDRAIMSLTLAATADMAIDETHNLLLVTNNVVGSAGNVVQGRFTVIDIDPTSPSFHQVVDEIPTLGGGQAFGIGINPITFKVYVAVSGGAQNGLQVFDGNNNTAFTIPNTPSVGVIVNDAANLVYSVSGTALNAVDGATDTRIAGITLPASGSVGTAGARLAVHKGSGHVYVRVSEFPAASRLVIIDGNRASPTFNTIQAQLVLDREDGTTFVLVDELANRVITGSKSELKTTVVDAITNAVVGTVSSAQSVSRATIDTFHHRAYLSGAIGFVQAVGLAAATSQAVLPVGVEVIGGAVDPATHLTYVSTTGATSSIALMNELGAIGSVFALPHTNGRFLSIARNPVTGRLYAQNAGANAAGSADALPGFVTVIDGSNNGAIATVPVGPFPIGIAVNEVTNKIYVGNGFDGAAFPGGITVIDGATNTAVQADISQIPATSTVPGQINASLQIAPNTATGKVYFRIQAGSTTSIGVLDGSTNLATPLPAALGLVNLIRVNPVLNRIYVGGQATGQPNLIHVLNGANDQEIATLQVGNSSPYAAIQTYAAVNSTTGRVYVADYNTDTVSVVDGSTNTVTATLHVGRGPTSVAVNEALNRIYVGSALDRALTIIDGATLRIVGRVLLPAAPARLEVDEPLSQIVAFTFNTEAVVAIVSDPGTAAPAITSVTQGANGTVVINADGTVTYTAGSDFTGSDSFTYTASDGHGGSTTGTVNVSVVPQLRITTASLPDAEVDNDYLETLQVTGATGTPTWSVTSGTLPGGLSFDNTTGKIFGFLLQSGTFTFTVQVKDSGPNALTASQTYTIVVGPPVITTTSLPAATFNTPYNQQLVVAAASGAVTWTIDKGNSPLLAWLSLSPNGVLSGTPPNYGTLPSFTVTVTDAANQVAVRTLTLTVSGALDVTPTALREGVVNETPVALPIVGGNGTRSVIVTAGTLPPGVTLTSTGGFTGVLTKHGTFNFTVQVTDCAISNGLPTCTNQVTPQVVQRALTWRVSPREQLSGAQTQPTISFGGPGGRRIAQTFTVGAAGPLTGIGLRNISCPSQGPVTVQIQRLTLAGLPDGNTIASGVSFNSNFAAITTAPTIDLAIDAQAAFIISSPTACTLNNAAVNDNYNAGDAYADSGAGWVPLFSTDGRYDVPSFVTLIQPAMDVAYLTAGRSGGTATLLNNGKVLVVAGTNADVYDPATNTTSATGNMSVVRSNQTATLLADGTVLVAGGRDNANPINRLATAEIFNPANNTFSPTNGPMTTVREFHAATRLADGRVLITGGLDAAGQNLISAELYDPATKTFSATGNLTTARQTHTSTLLASGKVLIAAGYLSGSNQRSSEIYTPATGTFAATTGNMIVSNRGFSAAATLADGRILVAGGQSGDVVNAAEIYDPATDAWTATGNMASKRYEHSLTTLADGSVLVAGGFAEGTVASYVLSLATLERFLPASGTFVPAGAMEARRARQMTVRLPNNKVLLASGVGQSFMSTTSAELFDLATTPQLTTTSVPDGQVGVPYPATVLTAAGGGGPPYQIAILASTLPPGLVYNPATLTMSGTPTANGVFQASVTVTDGAAHTNVQSLPIRVGTINVITNAYRLIDGAQNHLYSTQLTASGAPPIVFSLAPASGALPAGLSINGAGLISGTPTVTGFFTIEARAVDATGQVALKTLAINIQSPMVITTTTLPEHAVLEANTFCLGSSNGVGTRTWTVTTSAPAPGFALQSNGCNAAPTATGTFTFTAQLTDSATPPQVLTQDLTVHVSAREQQGNGQNQPAIAFGGAGGRSLAQIVTVGATGTLTGFGLTGISCSTAVTINVQRLTGVGLPDGTTIATGTASTGYNGIALAPEMSVTVNDRLAFVITGPSACTITNAPVSDNYQAGDAYANSGAGWVTLLSTDGRYDIGFRTLIMPATPVTYLARARNGLTATLLNTGKVLLTGNDATAELYDPATRTTALTGSMSVSRQFHTATRLPSGKVLVAGGRDQTNNTTLASAEVYDPATGTFAPPIAMGAGRQNHTATRLTDGRVLITGGFFGVNFDYLTSAEIYDPVTNTFSPTGSMATGRQEHTATLLTSGKVLVVSGYTSGGTYRSAEVYDPATATFSATTGSTVNRGRHTATLLQNGKVLVVGGQSGDISNTAELYDPATDTFAAAGSMLGKRYSHTATLLVDGSVLVAGGYDEQSVNSYTLPLASLERYLPASNSFVAAGTMVTRRQGHDEVRLPDNTVLFVGGGSQSWMTADTAEIYDLSAVPTFSPTVVPNGQVGVAYAAALTPTGGSGGPYQFAWVSGALPPGINSIFNGATFSLSGTPTAVGAFSVGLKVTDAAGHSNTQSLALQVGSFAITSPYSLPGAGLNVFYSYQMTSSAPATWSVPPGSSLPPGLTMNAAGLISGTPNTFNYYNFEVRAVDANGQIVLKAHAINVTNPLTITTIALPESVFNEGYSSGCLQSSGGNGNRTWTRDAGTLPTGYTLQTNGCFSGAASAFGTFNFTARVTDESSPPQTATQPLSITIAMADDQGSSQDNNQPALAFGGPGAGAARLGERVITGFTGTLRAVRLFSPSCPANTTITVSVQGIAANGGPDGNIVTSGSGPSTASFILLSQPAFFAADQQFTVVFSADAACTVRPAAFDSYIGEGYYANTGASWQRLQDFDGRFDIGFQTIVQSSTGLSIMPVYHGGEATATALNNGRVLVTGGNSNQAAASIYDPATGLFTPTGNMTRPRVRHTATLLPSGDVLIAGGQDTSGNNLYLNSAELYHPGTGTFELLNSTLSLGRAQHTATRISGSRVLLTGGYYFDALSNYHNVNTVDIYDTETKTFTPGPAMAWPRERHTATALNDGRVFVAGGWGSGMQGEIYDPVTNAFTTTAQSMVEFRSGHAAALLTNGKVLLTGGYGSSNDSTASAEVFDPVAGTFVSAGSMHNRRLNHTSTTLADGSVLIAGGMFEGACCISHVGHASLERYVPGTGFVDAGSMLASREEHEAVLLQNGQVLLVGTYGWSNLGGRTAELYDLATAVSIGGINVPDGHAGGNYPGAALTPQGGTGAGYAIAMASGSMPPGLQYDAGTRAITGLPTQSGLFYAAFTVVDGGGHSNAQAVTVRIDPVDITTSALPNAYTGVSYTPALSGTGVGSLTWSLVPNGRTPPPGLTLNPNGTFSGTPNSLGYYQFQVRAVDSIGQAAVRAVSINVSQPLTITTTYLDDPTAPWNYGWCLSANGGNGPRVWSVVGGPSTLPPGLTFGSNGCFNNDQPRKTGSYPISVQVTDGTFTTPPQQFTLRVGTLDQSAWQIDSQIPLPYFHWAGGVQLAQVFRVQMRGVLQAIEAPVFCDNASLHIEIQGVVDGKPNGVVVSAVDVPAARVASFAPFPAYYRQFPLLTTVQVPRGDQLALVLSSAGQCHVAKAQPDTVNQTFSSPGGDAFFGGPGSWTPLSQSDPARPDIPFHTLMGDFSTQDFMVDGRAWGTGTLLTSGINNGLVLFEGGFTQTTQLYNPTAGDDQWRAARTVPVEPVDEPVPVSPHGDRAAGWLGARRRRPQPQRRAVERRALQPRDRPVGRDRIDVRDSPAAHGDAASRNRVLIAGGQSNFGQPSYSTTEIFQYNPATHTGQFIAGPSMNIGRTEHSAVTLNDGRVLFSGGWGATNNTTAELYLDGPGATGSFVVTNGMKHAEGRVHRYALERWPCPHRWRLAAVHQHAGGRGRGLRPDHEPVFQRRHAAQCSSRAWRRQAGQRTRRPRRR
jgi:YVTN family beta-propeller protein